MQQIKMQLFECFQRTSKRMWRLPVKNTAFNPYWQHFGTITECHFRKQNPENFFIVTILVTSYIEHLKSCFHISKQQGVFYLYQKYFNLSTWRHHRQKFALDFVSENDARWKTQFLDFVSEICQYGLSVFKILEDLFSIIFVF